MADFTFAHREEGFDEHIEKSIRGYSHLLEDVVALSRYFVEDDTNVYDLGCSTGKMTQRLIAANYDHCTDAYWYGIEIGGFKTILKNVKNKYSSLMKIVIFIFNMKIL